MLSSIDIVDKSIVAGIAGLTGLTLGIGLTTIILNSIHGIDMDDEQRKRNLIPRNHLIQNIGTENEYDVINTYELRLAPLFNAIQEHYGLDKRNEFEKIIKSCALAMKSDEKNSDGDEMVFIPDLSIGLKQKNWMKTTGVDQSIIQIFEIYKEAKEEDKEGMDVNVVMMQILQNIIIIFNEFITENLIISENINKSKMGNLQAINIAMNTFAKDLKTTNMFRDRKCKLIQLNETRRQMNLPKIIDLITVMGEEAIVLQKKITVVEKSKEKSWKIWNAASFFAQSLERMSEDAIYKLPRLNMYSPFKRKDKIIHYNINSWSDSVSDKNDLIANLISKHMKNAYVTLFTDITDVNGSCSFSHTNHLLSLTNDNKYFDKFGTFNLPGINNVKTKSGKFDQALNEDDLKSIVPYIHQFFKYMYIAAAMQADLTAQLNSHGWEGLTESDELQYRTKLIESFIEQAKLIAKNNILGEQSYFRQFIERTNDPDFINEALDQDETLYNIITNNKSIIKSDRDKHYNATLNKTFNIPLNHMLHAEAMKKSGDEFSNIEIIDKQFSYLTKSNKGEMDCKQTSTSINNEFFYNLAFACQDDIILMKNIYEVESTSESKKTLDYYLYQLNNIKRNNALLFENYIFPEEKTSQFFYSHTHIKTTDGQQYKIKCSTLNDFNVFMQSEARKINSIFTINENGQYRRKGFIFKNKDSVLSYRQNVITFIEKFKTLFENELNNGCPFLLSLEEKCDALLTEVDQFNAGVDISEVAAVKLEKEKQRFEFEQTISQMHAIHQMKTHDLTTKIERIQSDQKNIIKKLFLENNQVFTLFLNTVKEQAEKYNQVLSGAEIGISENIHASYININESILQLSKSQESFYAMLNDTIQCSNESMQNSGNLVNISEQLLRHADQLSTIINQSIPEIIGNILSVMTSSTKDMRDKYQVEIKNLEKEMEQVEANEQSIKIQQTETNNTINSMEEQIYLLEKQLSLSNAELANQKNNIATVTRELMSLGELADRLSGITESQEYKNTKERLNSGINRFFHSGAETLSEEYASNSSQVDAEINDIMNDYNKIFAMVVVAEGISNTIKEKIDNIISINHSVNVSNDTVSNSIVKMNDTLVDQKKSVLELKNQIVKLQSMYDSARNSHMSSLKNQIDMLKSHENKIDELNVIIRDNQKKYEELMHKTTNVLDKELQQFRLENDKLKNEISNITNQNTNLVIKLNLEKQIYESKIESLQNSVHDAEKIMHESTLAILSESLNQFSNIKKVMVAEGEKSIKNLNSQQSASKNELNEMNLELNNHTFNTNDIFTSINKLSNPYNLTSFKISCKNLIASLNNDHEDRLNTTETGKKKWQWINTLKNELHRIDISSEEFMHIFKALLIIYLQNKDGNGLFNRKLTTTGKSIVHKLNKDSNNNIRELLFGTEDSINYDMLAGKLLCETVAIEKAKKIINPNDDSSITLTIHQFSRARSSLSSLALKNMIDREQLENTFHQEKMLLENKLIRVKNKTKEIKADICSKIKNIQSSSCNTFFGKSLGRKQDSINPSLENLPTFISQY